ncbi:hypothetical protein DLP05_064 [Stenotrophomonas phage vB_SmaS_DLP_5]|uniref:Uncharacterized protein n=1 Tax=Stenotrophomonas phage vB_SmaS_DLP_5 TaxID=2044561 RepID=A0A2D2W2C9_9CAUD|nr:hypothetical protein FDJ07_gp063 [Stenotrophomonas phage vB_SmaS_DLP_5]ATS92304.1 hypothetical protein DLP05_064 [Stenotrophomonas phage vB_SmaS_DLP_5]
MMKFLQQAQKEAFDPKQTIIKRLMKNLEGYRPARSHEIVHASDITKESFCPRQTALLDLTGLKKKDEYIDTPLQVTFDVGNALSDLFREDWGKGWVYGNWICVRCGQQRTFCLHPGQMECKSGGKFKTCKWRYEEMNFVCQKYDVSGSLDAVCDLGAPKLFVTELKIITPVDFEKLVAPLPEHRIRTNLYMNLIENSDSMYKHKLNLQQAKVLYISRAWGKMHKDYNTILPFKEFDVARDDSVLAPYLGKAAAIKKWRTVKKMPHGVCQTTAEPTAKKCSVCKECFSGKYPVSL